MICLLLAGTKNIDLQTLFHLPKTWSTGNRYLDLGNPQSISVTPDGNTAYVTHSDGKKGYIVRYNFKKLRELGMNIPGNMGGLRAPWRYDEDTTADMEKEIRSCVKVGPKFKMVLDTLEREIAPLGIAEWQKPKGGYFVSVNTMDGIAKRTLALCKEAGVVMTSAGATFPYGKDPRDRNIRVAPSLPPVSELEQAIEVFCVSMKNAALEKLLTE